MKLTPRSKKIILLLLEEENYRTIQYIADAINVSSRTVLRELADVENWLNTKGILLGKKKGTGIRICLQGTERDILKSHISMEKAEATYTAEQRLTLLKGELLKNSEITKLYSLTKLLDVTEATVSGDLDKLIEWMNKYRLKIVKKPGLGVYLEGAEIDIRIAIISLIYEQYHEAELIHLIFNQEKDVINIDLMKSRINQGILTFTDISHLKHVQRFLRTIETRMNLRFADHSFIALVIRICITIGRCQMGMFIDGKFDLYISKDNVFYRVKEWFLSYEDTISLAMPEAEIQYIVMHIKGAELKESHENSFVSAEEEIRILDLTKEVIYIAERETSIYLEDNKKLLKNLAGHLKMAIYRMKMQLDIMNPLLEDIKVRYPELFLAAKKCAQYIGEKEKVKVPEDEVAYLATHIGAAVKESKSNVMPVYRAAVVCANDMGAAQLLVSEIGRLFTNIQISSIISAMDIEGLLVEKYIDFIITTIELQTTKLPTVLVNPILNEIDRKHIREMIDNFLPVNASYHKIKSAQFENKLNQLRRYSDYILQILHNFLFVEQVVASNLEELSSFICRSLAKTAEERFQVEMELEAREEKGASILNRKGLALYHIYSKAIQEVSMITVRLKNPIGFVEKAGIPGKEDMLGKAGIPGKEGILEKENIGQKVDAFVLLSIPYEVDSCGMEIVNEITRQIINSLFNITLKQQTKEEIITELNTILDIFIQNKVLDQSIK